MTTVILADGWVEEDVQDVASDSRVEGPVGSSARSRRPVDERPRDGHTLLLAPESWLPIARVIREAHLSEQPRARARASSVPP
jgi:hypothetical protein